MEWFTKFIDEPRQLWQEQKEESTEDPNDVIFEIVETVEDLSNKEFGLEGENIIGHLLSQYEYVIGYPKNSETPADVWGLKDYG